METCARWVLGAQAAFGRRAVAKVWRLAAGTRLDRPCALVEAVVRKALSWN